ncbi:hypothetical protein ACFL35_21885, partial [Candidatus Riflebacteria bacterium]
MPEVRRKLLFKFLSCFSRPFFRNTGAFFFFFVLISPLFAAPPEGDIHIDSGIAYTNKTSVTLGLYSQLEGKEATKVKVSNTDASWSGVTAVAIVGSMTKSWTLTTGEGEKTVYARFGNDSNEWSSTYSASIIYDATAPTGGSLSINNDATYSVTDNVGLALSADGGLSGMSEINIQNGGGSDDTTIGYEESVSSWRLKNQEGTRTVQVRYKDGAGNWTSWISKTIIFDKTPPADGSVSINSGASYTSSRNVTLGLVTSDAVSGLSKMNIKNGDDSNNVTVNYTSSYSNWPLKNEEGLRTVKVRYQDKAGNWSSWINTTIIFDNNAPTAGSISINSDAAYSNDRNVTLTLSANGGFSGMSQMNIKNGDGSNNVTLSYGTSYSSWPLKNTEGTRTVSVRYKDGAGNWTSWISNTIIFDKTPPSATIAYKEGVATNQGTVNLQLASADADTMKISNVNSGWDSVTEETFSADRVWELTAGEGTKTVYARFKDAAQNWSSSFSKSIIRDYTAPTSLSITINNGSNFTTTRNVNLALGANGGASS